ncbi:hypothetical protein MHK_005402 [Candidatus Magnetomorum sp. HK-1]|nr:hypothetical protein MHK_005402 [Candidatus Magnetomorum sp. HK-1]
MSENINITTSKEFQLFIDEPLRQFACKTVEGLEDNSLVKQSQLHSIPGVIAFGGLTALKKLIDSQREKNTKQMNKAFWSFLHRHIFETQQAKEDSLDHFLRKQSFISSKLGDDTTAENKKQKKIIQKENKRIIENIKSQLISIYFEHFNCHYYYKKQGLS